MGTLTLLSQPIPRYCEFRPALSLGGWEVRGRAGEAQASLASSIVDVEESPTAPFSENTSPGREQYATPEGEWAVCQLSL